MGYPQLVDKGVTTQVEEEYLHPSGPLQTALIPTKQLTKMVILAVGSPRYQSWTK